MFTYKHALTLKNLIWDIATGYDLGLEQFGVESWGWGGG